MTCGYMPPIIRARTSSYATPRAKRYRTAPSSKRRNWRPVSAMPNMMRRSTFITRPANFSPSRKALRPASFACRAFAPSQSSRVKHWSEFESNARARFNINLKLVFANAAHFRHRSSVISSTTDQYRSKVSGGSSHRHHAPETFGGTDMSYNQTIGKRQNEHKYRSAFGRARGQRT